MSLPTPYYDDGKGIVIYLGDCRDILPHLTTDIIVTDPPYGILLNSSRNGRHGDCGVANDRDTSMRQWVIEWAGECAMLIFGSPRVPRPLNIRAVLVWDKGEHVGMGDLDFPWKPNWEEIYVLGSGFEGPRTTSVLRHLAISGCVGTRTWRHHPTEKPESLMSDLIRKCPAGTILDPFMGSGTTLVAAKDLGRQCIGIEIEEKYCEIAARRLGQEVLPL
jgi:site-specific DNA-methyltransferase (adenine-specific)